MEYTEDEGQCLVAEVMAKLAAGPVEGRYRNYIPPQPEGQQHG